MRSARSPSTTSAWTPGSAAREARADSPARPSAHANVRRPAGGRETREDDDGQRSETHTTSRRSGHVPITSGRDQTAGGSSGTCPGPGPEVYGGARSANRSASGRAGTAHTVTTLQPTSARVRRATRPRRGATRWPARHAGHTRAATQSPRLRTSSTSHCDGVIARRRGDPPRATARATPARAGRTAPSSSRRLRSPHRPPRPEPCGTATTSSATSATTASADSYQPKYP